MRTRLADFAHAPLEDIAHAELAAHVLHVDGPASCRWSSELSGDHEPALTELA